MSVLFYVLLYCYIVIGSMSIIEFYVFFIVIGICKKTKTKFLFGRAHI